MSTYEHNLGDHEDPAPTPTWMIGFISTVLLVVVFFGLTALYYRAESREDVQKLDAIEPIDLARMQREQTARLNAPARIVVAKTPEDREVGRRTVVPIETAKSLIVEEYGQ